MDNISQAEAVSRAQKYIQDNLKNKITLYEVAKHSGYSPWHISEIFKKYTNMTIFEYIRQYRLSKAALDLRDSDKKVIDVALEFIFSTHEGFTRAFAKEFGITPKKYSMDTPPIKLFLPFPIHTSANMSKGENTMEQASTIIFSQVIDRPRRKAIIKRGIKAEEYFQYCDEVGCEIWGELCSIKGALYEPMGMWLPEKLILPNTSEYVQGVEIPADYEGVIPQGYEVIDLDSCKMMIFQGPKYDDTVFEDEISKVISAINNYDPAPFGFKWANHIAPRFQYEPRGERGYIEGRPVELIL